MVDLNTLLQRYGIETTVSRDPAEGYQEDKSNRPQCSVPECNKLAVNMSNKKGLYKWRRANWIKEQYPQADNIWCCGSCHSKEIAKRNGVKTAKHLTAKRHGLSYTEYSNKIQLATAKKNGFDTITEYKNSIHPYLRYRKDYCENVDGRLGFVCTFTAPTPQQLEATGLDSTFRGWLQVDHKDGNHTNNDPSNLQTLCACCHNVKTYQNGDNATPGRKTREKEVDFF